MNKKINYRTSMLNEEDYIVTFSYHDNDVVLSYSQVVTGQDLSL